jgi:hypothetical protein
LRRSKQKKENNLEIKRCNFGNIPSMKIEDGSIEPVAGSSTDRRQNIPVKYVMCENSQNNYIH